jgi:hypothetical protein
MKKQHVSAPKAVESTEHKGTTGPVKIDPGMLPAILGNEYLGDPVSLKQAFEGIQDVGRILKIPFAKAFNAIKNFKSPHP